LPAEPTDAASGKMLDATVERWRDLGSWIAVFTGPNAVLLQLTFGFVLAPTARHMGSKAILLAISALTLAATAAAIAVCERDRRRVLIMAARTPSQQASRAHFVALGGLLLNVYSLLVLIAQTLPIFVLGLED
jgi:hypothetical protein